MCDSAAEGLIGIAEAVAAVVVEVRGAVLSEGNGQVVPEERDGFVVYEAGAEAKVPRSAPRGEEGDFFEGGAARQARIGDGYRGAQGFVVDLLTDLEWELQQGERHFVGHGWFSETKRPFSAAVKSKE